MVCNLFEPSRDDRKYTYGISQERTKWPDFPFRFARIAAPLVSMPLKHRPLEVLVEEDTLPVHFVMSHTAQPLLFLDKKIVTLVQISGATLSFPVLCHRHSHPSENQYLF